MSAPFPDRNFLTGNWRSLNDLARETNAPFPVRLPELFALDFDKIKDLVSAYRGWGLCSVDAVTIAEDGRIILIEFKDTSDSPVAWLKKKGFDSLLLFWIAVGKTLSMDDIRERAVFCYVLNPETRHDDEFYRNLQAASGISPIASKHDQLDELRNSGLYGDVQEFDPLGFSEMIRTAGVARSIEELQHRLDIRYRPMQPKPPVPEPRSTSGDFKDSVSPVAELRMPYPFDRNLRRKHKEEVLRVAKTYDANAAMMSWGHDWHQDYPLMGLMACCFDTFALWSLAYHSDKCLSELGEELNAQIKFSGVAPQIISEPPNTSACAYRHRFWDVYSPCFNDRYGLPVLERECLYGHISCEQT